MELNIWIIICMVISAPLATADNEQLLNVAVGSTVNLICSNIPYKTINAVDWTRPAKGLQVILYSYGEVQITEQDPMYVGRTELVDPEQTGDLILKNVTKADEGTYQCYILSYDKRSKRNAVPPTATVELRVHALDTMADPREPNLNPDQGQGQGDHHAPTDFRIHPFVPPVIIVAAVCVVGLIVVFRIKVSQVTESASKSSDRRSSLNTSSHGLLPCRGRGASTPYVAVAVSTELARAPSPSPSIYMQGAN